MSLNEKEITQIRRHDGKKWVSFVPKKDVKEATERLKELANRYL